MTTLVFDLDDTLYDQLLPFKKAVRKNFSFSENQIEDLYLLSRKFSDEVFEYTSNGEMSLTEMHVYRMQNACAQFGMDLSTEQAVSFQKDYERNQGQIQLFEEFPRFFDYCNKKRIRLALMTNGPTRHQWAKIHQLTLTNWIAAEDIFISAAVGLSKPDRLFFDHVAARMSLDLNHTYYIGDSYENDIVGAKQAGWQAVWANHRHRPEPETKGQYDYVLKNKDSLWSFANSL